MVERAVLQLLLFQAFLVGHSEFASTRQNARTFKLDNRTDRPVTPIQIGILRGVTQQRPQAARVPDVSWLVPAAAT